VPEAERAAPQRLLISLELQVDSFARAAAADDVALTVDYAVVAQRVQSLAQQGERRLIETLAEEIATLVRREFAVTRARVRIAKFVLPDAARVEVEIER
jgi:dihydroneopterin aldolase